MSDTWHHTSQPSLPLGDLPSSSASKSPARLCSERLQRVLEELLMESLSGRGSMIYAGDWKPHITPSGRAISRLRASVRRTSDSAPSSERSGWPTPAMMDGNRAGKATTFEGYLQHKEKHAARGVNAQFHLNAAADCSGWPTPMADNATKDCNRFREDRQNGLGAIASLSGWATPTTRDHKNTGNLETYIFGSPTGRVRDDSTSTQAYLAGWPTPTVGNADGSQMAKDASPTGRRPDGSKATVSLNGVAQVAGWPTPTVSEVDLVMADAAEREAARKSWSNTLGVCAHSAGWPTPIVNDTTGSTHCYGRDKSILLKLPGAAKQTGWPTPDGPARITADGQMLTGSGAGMESGGQLNPAHSRWLMGYPPEWCDCAVTATPSSRKRRQSSSGVSQRH